MFVDKKYNSIAGISELRPMSRDFFIKNVASWLPENSYLAINILGMEAEGKLKLFLMDEDICIIKDADNKIRASIKFRGEC